MKHFSLTLTLAGLALAGSSYPAAAASKHGHAPSVTVSAVTVMEWFSNLKPRAGSRDVVYAQVWQRNHPVPGAQLSATLLLGKHVLRVIKGGKTGKAGKAEAGFVVPKGLAGRVLTVKVTLRYRRSVMFGSNQLHVQR